MVKNAWLRRLFISATFVAGLLISLNYILSIRNDLVNDVQRLSQTASNKLLVHDALILTTAYNNELIRLLFTEGADSLGNLETSGKQLLHITDSLRKSEAHPALRGKIDSIHNLLHESMATFTLILHQQKRTAYNSTAPTETRQPSPAYTDTTFPDQINKQGAQDALASKTPFEKLRATNLQIAQHQWRNSSEELRRLIELENEVMNALMEVLQGVEEQEEVIQLERKSFLAAKIQDSAMKLLQILLLSALGLLVFLVIVNIEELRLGRLRSQLEHSEKQREEEWSSKEKYLLFLSHELKSPLNIISGFAGLLERKNPGRESKMIRDTSDYLLNMVNELLQFKKQEKANMVFTPRPVNIKEELLKTLLLFQQQMEEKGMILQYKFPEEQLFYRADIAKLQQIVINLMNNCIRHSSATEVVFELSQTLDQDQAQHGLHIRLTDNGIGMTSAQLHSLFEPFNQASKSFQSSGLGMHISQELAHLMGGTLMVRSEKHKGTDILLYVPVELAKQEETANSAEPDKAKIAIQIPTLLVDDDQLMAEILRNYDSEQHLHCVHNIQSAKEWIEKHQPQVVVIDWHLEGESGLTLLRWLHTRPEPCPRIILCSADDSAADEALAIGPFDSFLRKPFRVDFLVGHINEWKQTANEIGYSLENFMAYAQGDEAMLQHFIQLFHENTHNDLKRAEYHLRNHEYEALRELFHKMKNTLGQLRAEAITAEIELFLKGGQTQMKEAVAQQIIKRIRQLLSQIQLQERP